MPVSLLPMPVMEILDTATRADRIHNAPGREAAPRPGGDDMLLEGSCHCGAVRFRVDSPHPYPYQRCYCSICRKTAGGGGYAINLSGRAETLQVEGAEHKAVYRAVIDGETSPGERHFCRHCASALWIFDPRWPALLHPFASAIDSELPVPPERVHLLLDSKASWVEIDARESDKCFAGYPEESIAEWHLRLGLEEREE